MGIGGGFVIIRKLMLIAMRFLYRRLAKAQPKAPTGIPLMRDPDNRCEIFEPRPRLDGDFHDCHGDGHYLCRECCHFVDQNETE